MAMTLHIDIVSAEKAIYSGRAEMVVATGLLGELGIVPGHSQLITELIPGPVRILLPDGGEEVFYVSGGLLEIQPHIVTILADSANRAADLDESLAQDAVNKAKHIIHDKQTDVNYAEVLGELAQAAAQIRAIRKLRKDIR